MNRLPILGEKLIVSKMTDKGQNIIHRGICVGYTTRINDRNIPAFVKVFDPSEDSTDANESSAELFPAGLVEPAPNKKN